jgi:peptide/nickel transport system substrate-binding protein
MFKRSLQLAPILLAILTITALNGCKTGGGPANGLSTKNAVIWHQLSDIERLNPFLSTDEASLYVQLQMFEVLTAQNYRTYEWIPILGGLPEESADHLTFTFPINQGAHWSDGKPVTAADVIFNYKTVLNPLIINASQKRGDFYNLDSVYYPNGDQNKVAFHFNKFRYNQLTIINYIQLIPKHIFDPNGLSDKISWQDLHDPNSKSQAMAEFAAWFQDEKMGRDPKFMIGSGPYKYQQWITNDRIILQRDTNYWGKGRKWQYAYPDQLIFKTIKDQNAMLTALKAHDIDVTEAIRPNQYLSQVDTNGTHIAKDTVYENAYTFLAWNNSRPLFKSKKTRQALTMLVNRDEILHNIIHDLAKKIEGPVMPTQPNFDPTVKEPAFDVEGAKKLLAEDGWTDSDGDGILDKVIDGKRTPFKFTFQTNEGNETRKQILLVVANQLKKGGIDAGVSSIEWSVFLENQKSHNYDACYSGWVGNAGIEDDIRGLWHSSQIAKKGTNFYCYNSPEADRILDAIEQETDKAKRLDLEHQIQHLIVDDQPVTFLFSTPLFIAWQDRFDNVEFFRSRPPYYPSFWIPRGSGAKRGPNDIIMSRNPAERTN